MLFSFPSVELKVGERVKTRTMKASIATSLLYDIKTLKGIDLKDLVDKEVVHIVTQARINAFSFVQYFCSLPGGIKTMDAAVYRIGAQTLTDVLYLLDTGQIGELNLLVNDNMFRMKPDIWECLIYESSQRANLSLWAQDNHAKVMVIDALEKRFTIEGSGNLSINGHVEQYSIFVSDELAEWHREWIRKDDIKGRKAHGK